EAVHQGLVQRRSPAAQRVEDAESAGGQVGGPVGGQGGDVEQQFGEQLVGLAGVLLDGQQVTVERVQRPDVERAQQSVRPAEQRIAGREVRQQRDVAVRQLGG